MNRVSEKVPEKVPGGFGAEPGQVQQGSGEASGEGLGGFGGEPGQVQGSGEGSFRTEKVAEKVSEKVLGIFSAGPGQVQQVQQGLPRLASQHASERFAKIKRCGCWGYHGSLLLSISSTVKCMFSDANCLGDIFHSCHVMPCPEAQEANHGYDFGKCYSRDHTIPFLVRSYRRIVASWVRMAGEPQFFEKRP